MFEKGVIVLSWNEAGRLETRAPIQTETQRETTIIMLTKATHDLALEFKGAGRLILPPALPVKASGG